MALNMFFTKSKMVASSKKCNSNKPQPFKVATYAIFELVWWFHPRTIPIKFGKD